MKICKKFNDFLYLTVPFVNGLRNRQFWLNSHVTREMGIGVLLILQKMGEGIFSPQKGEIDKIVEEGCLGRLTYVCC